MEEQFDERIYHSLDADRTRGASSLGQERKAAAYSIKNADILLKADADGAGWTDQRIAEGLGCHVRTVENVRRRCVLRGREAALERKKKARPRRERKLDGACEARLGGLACGERPDGRGRGAPPRCWRPHRGAWGCLPPVMRSRFIKKISVDSVVAATRPAKGRLRVDAAPKNSGHRQQKKRHSKQKREKKWPIRAVRCRFSPVARRGLPPSLSA